MAFLLLDARCHPDLLAPHLACSIPRLLLLRHRSIGFLRRRKLQHKPFALVYIHSLKSDLWMCRAFRKRQYRSGHFYCIERTDSQCNPHIGIEVYCSKRLLCHCNRRIPLLCPGSDRIHVQHMHYQRCFLISSVRAITFTCFGC